jgi:hypothetical protein
MLLTGGTYSLPPGQPAANVFTGAVLTYSGHRVDWAAGLTSNSGSSKLAVREAPQRELQNLLREWIASDSDIADADFEAQKADLDNNRASFGAA